MPTPAKPAPGATRGFEHYLEAALFGGRWLLAPMYVGLLLILPLLVWVFLIEVTHELPHLLTAEAKAEDAILLALSLVDLSLAGNLILIVILSGYENFVSKIDTGPGEDRPSWMGKVDFSALKMKLIASIVAISAISLLKSFMSLGDHPESQSTLIWQVIIHVTFLASGVFMALMDWIHCMAEAAEAKTHAQAQAAGHP
jgi:uncharacterized protein (TIGR00645 family)